MVSVITSIAAKICRKMSPKTVAFSAISLTILLCIYYVSYTTDVNQRSAHSQDNSKEEIDESIHTARLVNDFEHIIRENYGNNNELFPTCPRLDPAEADINTAEVFRTFDFQPHWVEHKTEFWDKTFEDRYERQKMDAERPPLKVIIVPHSHNDPGWLQTFEEYYQYVTRHILNGLVQKLETNKKFTFIWSEIVFLNAWWEEAHPSKQKKLRQLIKSGRLEIVTGGWVMTDEATAHLYGMVDQLVEGHEWMLANLGVTAQTGWSVDPFGHGSTMPYLLSSSGVNATIIQRIHYAWKQWLALKQYGDFRWIPDWNSPNHPQKSILTHNLPYAIYTIQNSCGPNTLVCSQFDFLNVHDSRSSKVQITPQNIQTKSETLLAQYAKTGSLFPHNVALILLGDDFRFKLDTEWDQQYNNYRLLMNYINSNKDKYKTEIVFGTPKDYFNEIIKRYDQYPTLKGDFFVYADIFTEGRPAYWSGYYTTRPSYKLLSRELQSNLRGAEILYTIALHFARQQRLLPHIKQLEYDFEKLIKARRNFNLFQHHDAITGTSKQAVMRDYGSRLFRGIHDTISIQQNALQSFFFPQFNNREKLKVISIDSERDSYTSWPKKIIINITKSKSRKILVYNSLAQPRDQLISIRTNQSNIKIIDENGKDIPCQINPVWDSVITGHLIVNEFEIVFLAKLKQLSVTVYTLTVTENIDESTLSTVYCTKCVKEEGGTQSKFKIKEIPAGDIQLENHKFKILFNGNTGFMKTVTRKHSPKSMHCGIQFAAYPTAQFHSGAYLFMPDPGDHNMEQDVLSDYSHNLNIIIISGAVSSEISVIYGRFLVHTVTIFHSADTLLANAISLESIVDFEKPPKNRDIDFYMRIMSDIQNGEPPEFYSDLNGFQVQKRVKIEKIGIQGNYYPITTMAYIQDENVRLSLITDHAQGAASWQPGYLEVMMDRRSLYDDARGMGEGVVDSHKTLHRHWLLIEDMGKIKNYKDGQQKRFENVEDNFEKGDVLRSFNQPTEAPESPKVEVYSRPSLFANHLSNSLSYPANIFIVEEGSGDNINQSFVLLNKPFPCDTHLLTLRTQSDRVYQQYGSNSALLILHRQGYDCSINSNITCSRSQFDKETTFEHTKIDEITERSLTGIHSINGSSKIHGLGDINIEPMALKTFNITFM